MSERKEILKSLDEKGLLESSSIKIMRKRLKEKLLKDNREQQKELERIRIEIKEINVRLDNI